MNCSKQKENRNVSTGYWCPYYLHLQRRLSLRPWSIELKIKRDHLLVMLNVSTKFVYTSARVFHNYWHLVVCTYARVFHSYWPDKDFKQALTLTLTFDLVTSKSINLPCTLTLWCKMKIGQINCQLLFGQGLYAGSHYNRDICPSYLKINRCHQLVMTNSPQKYEHKNEQFMTCNSPLIDAAQLYVIYFGGNWW